MYKEKVIELIVAYSHLCMIDVLDNATSMKDQQKSMFAIHKDVENIVDGIGDDIEYFADVFPLLDQEIRDAYDREYE